MTLKHKRPQRSERSLATAAMCAHNAASDPSSRGSEPDAARAAPGPPWSAVEYASTHPHDVRLRLVLGDGNEVVSRCKNGGRLTTSPTGGLLSRPISSSFRVGRRAARSSQRWPAPPLLPHRFRKAIDAGKGGQTCDKLVELRRPQSMACTAVATSPPGPPPSDFSSSPCDVRHTARAS